MPSSWESRIARAETLSRQHPFAAEMLSFYIQMARAQQHVCQGAACLPAGLNAGLPAELTRRFAGFLSAVEDHAPARLNETIRQLQDAGSDAGRDLLHAAWSRPELSPSEPQDFLARAFLQPIMIALRERSRVQWNGYPGSLCPFCGRKPGAGILRPRGDGGQRSLFCAFCLAEWEFRRIVCAGCGEVNERKLDVYQASEFDYVRVECCQTCKQYLKTIDLTKNGLADPLVDEIASAPLDLWAREQGYSKLELNLVGM